MTEDAGAGSETSEPPISGLLLDLDGVLHGDVGVPGGRELFLFHVLGHLARAGDDLAVHPELHVGHAALGVLFLGGPAEEAAVPARRGRQVDRAQVDPAEGASGVGGSLGHVLAFRGGR